MKNKKMLVICVVLCIIGVLCAVFTLINKPEDRDLARYVDSINSADYDTQDDDVTTVSGTEENVIDREAFADYVDIDNEDIIITLDDEGDLFIHDSSADDAGIGGEEMFESICVNEDKFRADCDESAEVEDLLVTCAGSTSMYLESTCLDTIYLGCDRSLNEYYFTVSDGSSSDCVVITYKNDVWGIWYVISIEEATANINK